MPITLTLTLNLTENPFFQEAFAEGEQKGRAEGLAEARQEGRVEGEHMFRSKLLERRFGPLPRAVMTCLRVADAATLERWGMRPLTAHSLDEVLADE